MNLVSLVATVFAAAKFAHGLVTVRKELDTQSLNLRQVQKLCESYGGTNIINAVEEMQERTNARLRELEELIKALKESRFEIEDGINHLESGFTTFKQTPNWCGTNLLSSSTQRARMLRSLSSSLWMTLNTTSEETWKWNKWRQRIWLDVIEDPSPPVLVVKWFSVALLGLAIYHDHLNDRYQDYFLVAGLGAAATVAHHFSESLMSGIQTYLPFCVILALCLSALVHRLGRAMNGSRSRREGARLAWGK